MKTRKWVCKSACGECCGCVLISRSSWKKYQSRAARVDRVVECDKDILPVTTDGMCCFLNDVRECSIYRDRPPICRIYGRSSKIPCPYIRPDGSPRSYHETLEIKERINCEVDAGIAMVRGLKQ